jgi:hypothetical protein
MEVYGNRKALLIGTDDAFSGYSREAETLGVLLAERRDRSVGQLASCRFRGAGQPHGEIVQN